MGHPVPDLCPIHRATGHSCPGCGMTRAFVLLWRGRLRQAVISNPASPFFFATLVWLAIEPIRRRVRQPLPVSVPSPTQQEQVTDEFR